MADFLTSIGDFLGLNKGKATQNAAAQNQGLLSSLDTTGTGYLTQAEGNTKSLMDLAGKGAGLYSDAVGVNGPEGNARATDAFHVSPGYQFGVDQGTQALMRTAAARGEVGGGELPIDLAKYITGTADKEYGNWLSDLAPYNSMLTTATGAENGALGNLVDFKSGIASGQMGANNQQAAGEEAGQGGLWDLLGHVADIGGTVAGSMTGMKKPMPGFGGYGAF